MTLDSSATAANTLDVDVSPVEVALPLTSVLEVVMGVKLVLAADDSAAKLETVLDGAAAVAAAAKTALDMDELDADAEASTVLVEVESAIDSDGDDVDEAVVVVVSRNVSAYPVVSPEKV